MTYIKPTRRRQTNILDYQVIISINKQIEQLYPNTTIKQHQVRYIVTNFQIKETGREDIWIHKLKALKPHEFNGELNLKLLYF